MTYWAVRAIRDRGRDGGKQGARSRGDGLSSVPTWRLFAKTNKEGKKTGPVYDVGYDVGGKNERGFGAAAASPSFVLCIRGVNRSRAPLAALL